MSTETLMPVTAEAPSTAQRTFVRYYTGVFMDLVVLGLFAQYWDRVHVDSFSTCLLAAIVLQVLLKATIWVEHKVGGYFKARKPSGMNTFLRYLFAWLVLFGSKFVILDAITFLFGKNVHFDGRWHGIIPLIIVVVVMLVAEEVVVRVYRRLGKD